MNYEPIVDKAKAILTKVEPCVQEIEYVSAQLLRSATAILFRTNVGYFRVEISTFRNTYWVYAFVDPPSRLTLPLTDLSGGLRAELTLDVEVQGHEEDWTSHLAVPEDATTESLPVTVEEGKLVFRYQPMVLIGQGSLED